MQEITFEGEPGRTFCDAKIGGTPATILVARKRKTAKKTMPSRKNGARTEPAFPVLRTAQSVNGYDPERAVI